MAERWIPMETRLSAALATRFDSEVSVTALCADLGISRDTYYRLRARFADEGLEGLLGRSRRPASSPSLTPPDMVSQIVAIRRELAAEGWDAGARSIGARLRRRGLVPPSDRTIHRVLVRAGLVVAQPRKRPRSSFRRFEAARPNQMWQLDGTSWKLADGTKVTIVRLEDDCSRKIMSTRAAPNENSTDAWECMLTAMRRHGAPAAVLSDGGSAFTARRTRGGLSDFEALLRAHGISPIVSSPHHPQTCGKKEREWATCARWLTARPPAHDLAALQRQLDVYDALYNTDRPHQALHGQTPDQRYHATAKDGPADQPLPTPVRCTRVKVSTGGAVTLGNHYLTSVGTEWAHTHVDVIRDNLDVVIIHTDHIIQTLRIDPTRRYQPSGRKPRPRPKPRTTPLPAPLLSDMS